MNKKEKTQFMYTQECIQGRLSVKKLCDKLKVTPAGLGSRIIRLHRLAYQDSIKDEQ